MSKTIVITGANRGIGLEVAKQLQAQNYQVIALCRQASEGLKALDIPYLEGIEVGEDSCLEKIQSQFEAERIFAIINNAGMMERNSLDNLDFGSLERQMQVNAFGPLRVIKALLPRLAHGSKILNITSRMGSIDDNTSGGSYGYRMSKTALNMASVSLAQDLQGRGIAVGIVHPGFVRTEMSGNQGMLSVEESAQGILARLAELKLENSGTFWHVNGEILPW